MKLVVFKQTNDLAVAVNPDHVRRLYPHGSSDVTVIALGDSESSAVAVRKMSEDVIAALGDIIDG